MAAYIKDFILILGTLVPIYLVLRRPWRFHTSREWGLAVFFLLNGALLVLALRGSYDLPSEMLRTARERLASGDGINLTPLATIRSFLLYGSRNEILVNLLGNIVMFLPFGFGLPLLWKKNRHFCRFLLQNMLFTLCIETFQLFICRQVDVDDLILNLSGGLLGGLLWYLTARNIKAFQKWAR